MSTLGIVFDIEVPQTDVVPGQSEADKAPRASSVDSLMDPSLEQELDGFLLCERYTDPQHSLTAYGAAGMEASAERFPSCWLQVWLLGALHTWSYTSGAVRFPSWSAASSISSIA